MILRSTKQGIGIQKYIAKRGKLSAHGKTLKDAISDVNFKYLQSTIDLDKFVAYIKPKVQ